MSKQLVEFESVNRAEDIEILEILGKSNKDVFIKVEETGDIFFNGVNLSEHYDISKDKVIKYNVTEDDKLVRSFKRSNVRSFTAVSEDKIIDISKHLNDVKKGYELQNILATDFINIKDQYQSVDGKDNIEIKSIKPISDYKLHIKGCEKTIYDKYPKGSFLVRTHPTSEFKVMTNSNDSGVAYFNNKEVKIDGTTTIDLGEKKEHDILFVITEGVGFSLYNMDNPHIKHISYIPNSKDVIFEIDGKPKIIGNNAFEYCSGFTGELKLPESITSIEYNAFEGCSGFTSLKLPDSVTSIKSYAFDGCSGFTGDLIIPENVTSIESGAFKGCSGFTGDLIIPDSVTSIEYEAFDGCSGFTGDLIIPESVTSIESSAFDGCSGFTGDLIIPDSVTSIGTYAFASCSGFTGDLIIPDSVTSIGNHAFYNCEGLSKIYVCEDTELGNAWNNKTTAEVIKYKKGETPWITDEK